MQFTITIPDPRRLPHPQLSPVQWAVVGGAAILGVAEVLSAPIALAVAAAPLVDRYVLRGGDGSKSTTVPAPATRSRRSTATGRSTAGRSTGSVRRSPRATRTTSTTSD